MSGRFQLPIVDVLSNAMRYTSFHSAFTRAFEFLRRPDLADLPLERHDIDDERLYCLISKTEGCGHEGAKLEAHRRYIDIQYVISGDEVMGWKPADACGLVEMPYDLTKDIVFFGDKPDVWKPVPAGSFAIFFPVDAHAPLAGKGLIHKAVVKVAVK
jgi:YhcH/YjgK/YiaL family protein